MRAPPAQASTLSRRDLILLPLVAMLTVLLMLGGGEAVAQLLWPSQADLSCRYQTSSGERYRPHCTAMSKPVDGPWVTNTFNECGYRTAESCAVRPGALRAVIFGSSTSRGHGVDYAHTFAAVSSQTLTSACGRPVDFQNLGSEAEDIMLLPQRMPEALRLKPNLIILLLTPYDLQHLTTSNPRFQTTTKAAPGPAVGRLKSVMNVARESHLFLIGQHYLYRDPAVQVAAFLRNGVDDLNGYVVSPLPPAWAKRVGEIDHLLQTISPTARAAGVPILVVYVPRRAHVLLEIPKFANAKAEPRALTDRLQAVAASNGADFLDLTPAFAAAPNAAELFYLADGHPNADAHAILSRSLVARLLASPAFAWCTPAATRTGPSTR